MTRDERAGPDWRGWVVPGAALLVAAVLLVLTAWPKSSEQPAGAANPSQGPSASPEDDHAVATDDGMVTFRFEDGAIVVRLESNGAVSELGRGPVLVEPAASTGSGASATVVPTGAAVFAMVCGEVQTPNWRRYVFGRVQGGDGARYSGPTAVGRVGSDGLFLFALSRDAKPAHIDVVAGDESRVGLPADVFERAAADGDRQASGCAIFG